MQIINKLVTPFLALICATAPASDTSTSPGLQLTENGEARATIVIPVDAPEYTRKAAKTLVDYLEQSSGAKLTITDDPSTALPVKIWVGYRPELAKLYPEVDLALNEPEEIVLHGLKDGVVIIGRDLVRDGKQIEAGTHQAVSTFLRDQVGVRWLWPGPLGTDVPQQPTMVIKPFEHRYHPQVRWRSIPIATFAHSHGSYRFVNKRATFDELAAPSDASEIIARKDRQAREWLNHHRCDSPVRGEGFTPMVGSLNYREGHIFHEWYPRYGKEHPDWFAMQPDGTRTPFPNERNAKLCPSNPGLASQWVRNTVADSKTHPDAWLFPASESDRGWMGYCLCENCLAMDNPNGEILERPIKWAREEREFYSLTDRYVKFWNSLARDLQAAIPKKKVGLSVFAYHVTRPAPTIPLEKNIMVAFIGIERRRYSRNSRSHVESQRAMWKGWWEAVGRENRLVWRPNLMYRNIGFPYIFTRRHSENMAFMADHGLVGISLDPCIGDACFATQGPQHYLNVELAWNPKQDSSALMDDYYKRAFGPAAGSIRAYFEMFETLYLNLAEAIGEAPFSPYSDPLKVFREMHLLGHSSEVQPEAPQGGRHHEVERQAEHYLNEARAAVKGAQPIYVQRVEFIGRGFAYLQAQLDCMEVMQDLTAGRGDPTELRTRGEEAASRRRALLREGIGDFSLNPLTASRDLHDQPEFLGPPSAVSAK